MHAEFTDNLIRRKHIFAQKCHYMVHTKNNK